MERSPATPESGSDLCLELPDIRSRLLEASTSSTVPTLHREGHNSRGEAESGETADHGAHAGACCGCQVSAFNSQVSSSPHQREPQRVGLSTPLLASTNLAGSDEHHIAGFLAALPQDGLTASKYQERARSTQMLTTLFIIHPLPATANGSARPSPGPMSCACVQDRQDHAGAAESRPQGRCSCGGGTGRATSTS